MQPNKSELRTADRALEILVLKLEEAKIRNKNVSLRGFAQRLGLSSGALSEILQGKRPLSHSLKKRIADKLLLSPQETLEFFQAELPSKLAYSGDQRLVLNQDQFHLISDWWYFGLLNLIKTKGFRIQFAWMAKRLGLKTTVVQEAWDRLLRLGYLEQKGNQITRKSPNVKTTDEIMSTSIRKSHQEDLKLIEKSILDIPLELRDNTSCTFVVNKKDLAKAKELIRIFQSQFLGQIGQDSGEEVYKLSVALYPLTQVLGERQ